MKTKAATVLSRVTNANDSLTCCSQSFLLAGSESDEGLEDVGELFEDPFLTSELGNGSVSGTNNVIIMANAWNPTATSSGIHVSFFIRR